MGKSLEAFRWGRVHKRREGGSSSDTAAKSVRQPVTSSSHEVEKKSRWGWAQLFAGFENLQVPNRRMTHRIKTQPDMMATITKISPDKPSTTAKRRFQQSIW